MAVALESLGVGGLDDAQVLYLPEWAKGHKKFWADRIPTYASLAKAMRNKSETGLLAQFRAHLVLRRKAEQAKAHAGQPAYRAESGQREILKGNV